MRILLFTGKGGVGKTTISAATGFVCAELGYKTLVMSTDPAHSLSDSFGKMLTGEATKLAKNLYAQEIDPEKEIKENWETIQKYLSAVLAFQGLDEIIADEIAIFPGMEELFSLMKIKDYYDHKSYDVLIADCAPTGQSLRLLSFPEVTRWYMRNLFPLQRETTKIIRPVVQRLTSFPLPKDEIYDTAQEIYQKISDFKDILSDEKNSSIRLVVNLEKMVIKEAQRGFTYLHLFGFPVDTVIVNRIIPPEVTDPYFDHWKKLQPDYLSTVEECFSPLPILKAKLYNQEVIGLPLLKKLGEEIYSGKDPSQVFYRGKPLEIAKSGDGTYLLSLHLPLVTKEDLEVFKHGEELIIRAGRYKRNILLPHVLVKLDCQSAKFEKDILKIKFG